MPLPRVWKLNKGTSEARGDVGGQDSEPGASGCLVEVQYSRLCEHGSSVFVLAPVALNHNSRSVCNACPEIGNLAYLQFRSSLTIHLRMQQGLSCLRLGVDVDLCRNFIVLQ